MQLPPLWRSISDHGSMNELVLSFTHVCAFAVAAWIRGFGQWHPERALF